MNYMVLAIEEALRGIKNQDGGPFGCCIVKDGKIIALSHNKVILTHDPTSHAEIEAIRTASKKLGTHDLEGCVLYTTCEPCPMCLFAIMWAKIETVYFGCDRKDASNIGFRDEKFYSYLKDNIDINLKQINRKECLDLFQQYKDSNHEIY